VSISLEPPWRKHIILLPLNFLLTETLIVLSLLFKRSLIIITAYKDYALGLHSVDIDIVALTYFAAGFNINFLGFITRIYFGLVK
jgi:hypothetical protein